jgi:serine/threonine protein kinase
MEFLDSFRRKKKDSKSTANSKQSGEVYYQKGSFIGQKYEVYGEVGHGGFGIVYKVYSHETKSVFALKTFKDEYLEDAETRKLFRREANVWVELERHSYVVRAYFVEKVAGRLYIGMEYIAKDEQGRNTLQDYLTHQPPDLAQSLRWAVQFCYGIEYAYSKGVRCHRDIKPSNIMISTDKTVKITDFGLAGVLGASKAMSGVRLSIQQGRVGLSGSIMEGRGCGTPTHMPPEQFTDAASCDQRSDIYAFGVVLYQMAAGDRLPFLAALPKDNSQEEQRRFWKEMYKLHNQALVPKLNSPLFSIIQRCLEKQPTNRYQTFKELRADLEPLLRSQTGETIKPPESKHLEAWEWLNKGTSLQHLGRSVEALECYDKALEINPQDVSARGCLEL